MTIKPVKPSANLGLTYRPHRQAANTVLAAVFICTSSLQTPTTSCSHPVQTWHAQVVKQLLVTRASFENTSATPYR